MTYLQDRRNKNSKIRNIIIGVVILFFISYFHTPIFKNLSYVANTFFKPIINIGNNIGSNLSNTKSFFLSKKTLELENSNLKKELAVIKDTSSNYQSIKDENDKLKEVLGRKKTNNTFIVSAIISKPNKSFYDTLIIDSGLDNGINIGDLVFAAGNIPIGKIMEVFDTSSKVVLFSTSGEKTDVVVNNNGAFMQVVGRGGGNFEMILPRDFQLLEGEEIIMPGLESYLLAKVVTIISDPRDSYKKALLISPVNIQELKFVQVEK